jgi:two-component system, NarL family, nitrate/nitrite response regulator NarL
METHPAEASRRALILDDDPMVGVLLKDLVASFGFTTRRARTVSEARKIMASLDPDVALVDIDLGHGPSGLDFARIIGKSHPDVGIVFLSRFSEADSGVHSIKGVPDNVAYLSKLELYDTQVVRDTIEECLRPSLEIRSFSRIKLEMSGLTQAQYDLVVNVAAGLSPSDIAQARDRSVRSIELMMNRIQEQHPELVLDSKRARTESAARFLESFSS